MRPLRRADTGPAPTSDQNYLGAEGAAPGAAAASSKLN
jgi:hypothetical protein